MADTQRIVIVGAGMAGLVAAVQAQALGARVVLLEKGAAAGGSLAMSGGTLWCARTFEGLRRLVPRGDPELGRVLVQDFPDGVQWLSDLGANLLPIPAAPDRVSFKMMPGPRDFVAHMVSRFKAAGGALWLNTAGQRLLTDASGAVSGIVVRTPEGQQTINAGAVILTSGGFQGNPDLTARYFGRWIDRLILRSNPHSTGDGWLMGTEVGAAASQGMNSFYGHLLPAPPAQVPTDDFIAYTQYHSDQALLVNLRGERFVDESQGDEVNCQATAREPEALACLIYDHTIYTTYAVRQPGPGARRSDTFFESQALGAPAVVAATLEELAETVQTWGFYGAGVLDTVRTYNAAVAAGQAAHLRIPRAANPNPIVTPPFYALAVTPGITFTLGGLRINGDAQVLDRSGRPIPGLYAAGADAGGIHNERYGGGLCLGLVFGRRAAHHACATPGSRP